MLVIIAGSRSIHDYAVISEAVEASGFKPILIISGGARGVDSLGEEWAEKNGVPVRRFLALWNVYGKRAGYIRNADMAKVADALVAVWDGKSKGTKHMIDTMRGRNKPVYIHVVPSAVD